MKHTLLFLLLFVSVWQTQAQFAAEVEPQPASFDVTDADLSDPFLEYVIHSNLKHLEGEEEQIRWQIEVVSAPEEWCFFVCDELLCYTCSVVSNMESDGSPNAPITLSVDESSRMDVHLRPNEVAGVGTVNIKFSLASSPAVIFHTATYDFCVNMSECVVSVNEEELKGVSIYPNPVYNDFQISANDVTDNVVIYNIIGKEVKTFTYQDGASYDIGDLPNGVYMASLTNNHEGILKTVRLVKRDFRP